MADYTKLELNLDDLNLVNGGVMFAGHDYTPEELLALYNEYPDQALFLIKTIKTAMPDVFAQAIEEIKAYGIDKVPAPILEEFGEYLK